MALIYLVRHGQAASGWGEDQDPPLSETGSNQAKAVAQTLEQLLSKNDTGASSSNPGSSINIVSSPILRARETAIPFCQLKGKEALIETRVAEIPTPISDMDERMPWLMSIMKDNWENLSPELLNWRQSCIDYLSGIKEDTVIFSHYIAINVAIGFCKNDGRVICHHPDNTSINIFESKASENKNTLSLVSLGKQADTKIN